MATKPKRKRVQCVACGASSGKLVNMLCEECRPALAVHYELTDCQTRPRRQPKRVHRVMLAA